MLPLKMQSYCGTRQTNEILRFTTCFPSSLYNFLSVFICSREIRAPFGPQDVKSFSYSCGDNVLKYSIYAVFGGSNPPPYMNYSTIFMVFFFTVFFISGPVLRSHIFQREVPAFFSLRPISSAFVKTSGCFLGKSHGRLVFIDVE